MIFTSKILSIAALAVSALCACGQALHIEEGQSWEYEFNSIPFKENALATVLPGIARFTLTGLASSEMVQVNFFENSTSEQPLVIGSRIIGTDPAILDAGAPEIWRDLQGVVRLTAVTGDVYLHDLTIQIWLSGDRLFDARMYEQVIPVPEPIDMGDHARWTVCRLDFRSPKIEALLAAHGQRT